MDNILDVAQYMLDSYEKLYSERMGETKLQKLLYFAQRESLAITNEPLFNDRFEGWIHGPVSRNVRLAYNSDYPETMECKPNGISNAAKYIVNNILFEYGKMTASELVRLSHEEISWKNARKGLRDDQPGDRPLLLDDIRQDSHKIRPYDHVWDMYYDEFDTVEEATV